MPRKSKAIIAEENKKARECEERERAALRWSDDSDIDPDVAPPEGIWDLTTGFYLNKYYIRVEVACSSSVSHSIGRNDKTTSQGAKWLYSTEERALRALRVEMEHEFAGKLASIDEQLARIKEGEKSQYDSNSGQHE